MRLRDRGFAMLSTGIGLKATGIELSFDAVALPPRGISHSEPVDEFGCSNCDVGDSLSRAIFSIQRPTVWFFKTNKMFFFN